MITGASSGIGKAPGLAFAAEGNPAPPDLAPIFEPIAIAGRHRLPRRRRRRLRRIRPQSRGRGQARAGRMPRHNAGSRLRGRSRGRPRDYSREIDTNLKGVFNCTKAVLSGHDRAQSGTIVNISSISDRKTAPVRSPKTASKKTLSALPRVAARAEANSGIRVINIAPGYIGPTFTPHHISFEEYSARSATPIHDRRATGRDRPVLLEAAPSICNPRPRRRPDPHDVLRPSPAFAGNLQARRVEKPERVAPVASDQHRVRRIPAPIPPYRLNQKRRGLCRCNQRPRPRLPVV